MGNIWEPLGDRACVHGGAPPPSGVVDTIEYVTISSTGDVTDFGNLTAARNYSRGAANSTR